MDNIRDELTKIAQGIAVDYALDPSTGLSERVALAAKQANLDPTARQLLVGITNKQYMDKTGNTEFDLADPNEVTALMYENAPPKTASYNYPEYSNVLFGDMSYHQKSASMHQVWEQNKDVTKLIGAKYNRDYDSAFEEFSGLMNKTASLGDSLSEKLAMFHSLKYTPEELISSLSKTAHLGTTEKNVIKTVMSKFASNELVDPNVRYMYDLSDDLSELRQQLSSFVKTASRLPEAESKFRSIEENRNLLIRVGKVEI